MNNILSFIDYRLVVAIQRHTLIDCCSPHLRERSRYLVRDHLHTHHYRQKNPSWLALQSDVQNYSADHSQSEYYTERTVGLHLAREQLTNQGSCVRLNKGLGGSP